MENKPSYEMITLCEAYVLARAHAETLRPIIDEIYNDILKYHWPEGFPKNKRTGEQITDHDDLFMADMSDPLYLSYHNECQLVLVEKGFPPSKEGNCPALEAESLVRDTERFFLEACCKSLPPHIGLTYEALWQAPMKLWKEFLEINLSYVVPFVNKEKLLKDIAPNK